MKKILIIAVLCLTLGIAGAAQAFWVGSVYNGDTNTMVPNVMGFDWSSSGSGLTIGVGPAGTPQPPGTNFDFLFQATLVGLTDPAGDPVIMTGLNTTYEYTLVAQIPETIIAAIPLGGGLFQYVFDVIAPGSWYLYYDSGLAGGQQAVVASGTGFEDGDLVAAGTFNYSGLEASTFLLTGLNPATGVGSFILEGLVTPGSVNPAYLDPAITIFDFRAEGTLNLPPLDSTTIGFFDVAGGPYARYIYDPTGDILFKADASSKFSTIPEPSTLVMLGVGLLGLAGAARKRTKK